MKLVVLVAFGLLLAPIAVAEQDNSCRADESADECQKRQGEAKPERTPDEPDCDGTPEECKQRYCAANEAECRDMDCSSADCSDKPECDADCKQDLCSEHPEKCDPTSCDDCQEECDSDCRKELCQKHPQKCDKVGDFEHISFDVVNGAITDYAVNGRPVLDSLRVRLQEVDQVKRVGSTVVIRGEDWRLVLHDNPTGLISFQGDSAVLIDFASDDIEAKGNGLAVEYDDYIGFLTSKARELDNGHYVVTGKAQFHIVNDDDNDERDEKVREAIEKRKVGAEVKYRNKDADADVLTYDEMNVTVSTPAKITKDAPMRVVVSAELDEGRTIVIDVEKDHLSGPDLELRYFDVLDDGNETEVVFRMADSLEDVLDATDDGGQPEYWVVKDANGIQVIASIPTWSTHAITISSIGEFVTQPSVLVGIGAGVAGVAVAALAMLRPRRD